MQHTQDLKFPLVEAKKLKDNLDKNVYPDALEYLTGSGEDQRGLSVETLKKYNVGLGTEKFTNDEGSYQGFDSIYFPIYAPRQHGNKSSVLDNVKTMKQA